MAGQIWVFPAAGEISKRVSTHRSPKIPMVKPLQPLPWLKENHLNCPHGKPHKHHRHNLPGEVDAVRPERLVPDACEKLGDEEEGDGKQNMAVVSCCVRKMAPATPKNVTLSLCCE